MEPTDLLQKSRLLTTLREDESYTWFSPDALLIVRRRLNRELLWKLRAYITKHDYHNPQNRWWNRLPYPLIRAMITMHSVHHRDIRTGKETPYAAFNRRHSQYLHAIGAIVRYSEGGKQIVKVGRGSPKPSLSPDGLWLLWKRFDFRSPETYRVARLDGTEAYEWKVNSEPNIALWLPGSRRWVEVIEKWQEDRYIIPEIRFKRIGKPEYERAHVVSGFEDGLPVGITKRCSLLMRHTNYVHGPDGKVERKYFDPVMFSELDLYRRPLEARRFEIIIPAPSWVWDTCLSPDENRLGWIIEHFGNDKERYGPSCLWISNRDGSDFQMIGSTEARKNDLQWSSDGTHLTFREGENLYAVPVGSV